MSTNPKRPPEIPRGEMKFPTKSLPSTKPKTFRWVLIGLTVLLGCILAGLLAWLYFLQQTPVVPTVTPQRPTAAENNEPESTTAEAVVETQQATSPSTELDAIANDLSGTTITNLDPLFADIEAMFEQ